MNNLMMSIKSVELIIQELGREVEGDVVEVGCNNGLTSIAIALNTDKIFHCFDYFAEIPDAWKTEPEKGEHGVPLARLEQFINLFQANGIPVPVLHIGDVKICSSWPERISLALIDVDYYSATVVALKECKRRLVLGGTILVHDYHQVKWGPGIRQACKEVFGIDLEYRNELAIWRNN